MGILEKLFENNENWARKIKDSDPDFFLNLSKQQKPEYLWIGCSDSRLPPNQIVGLLPGEVFVHRNIANIVSHNDMNCLSVIQYAVKVLKVKHIIVCGHYGCRGVQAAMENSELGFVDNWLQNIKDVYRYNQGKVDLTNNKKEKADLLCELNVTEQVINVCRTEIVKSAWKSGQELEVHGLIYKIDDGTLKKIGVHIKSLEELIQNYKVK